MFRDESGKLENVPSVDTLRKELKDGNSRTESTSYKGKTVLTDLMGSRNMNF
jgi:hypothetical protein